MSCACIQCVMCPPATCQPTGCQPAPRAPAQLSSVPHPQDLWSQARPLIPPVMDLSVPVLTALERGPSVVPCASMAPDLGLVGSICGSLYTHGTGSRSRRSICGSLYIQSNGSRPRGVNLGLPAYLLALDLGFVGSICGSLCAYDTGSRSRGSICGSLYIHSTGSSPRGVYRWLPVYP